MNAFSKLSLALIFAVSSGAIVPAHAADSSAASVTAKANQDTAFPMSEGEIKKVDKDTGKLTIKHGELKNLSMPPMTMVFRAKDAAMLNRVKPGDKVSFVADKAEGQFIVTKIEVK